MAEDPVVKSGRREALVTLGLWLSAGAYTIGYCSSHAYQCSPADTHFVLWFPAWMFWGVVVPWLTCAALSCLFALFFMQDAPLESRADVSTDELAAGDFSAGNDPAADSQAPGGRP